MTWLVHQSSLILVLKSGVAVLNVYEFTCYYRRAFTLSAAALVTMLGWTFAEDLPAAFLLQTAAFVAFNKVATAQYFVWHLSWLPLVLPSIRRANRNQLLLAAAGWVIALAHWLAWAYALEFAGRGVHAGVWFAGLVWVAANAALLVQAVKALRPKQSFD
jgi:GPI mannosyltransferase 1 subunit M